MVTIEAINGDIELNDGFTFSLKGGYLNWEAKPTTTSVEVLFIDPITNIGHQGSFITNRAAPTEKWAHDFLKTLPWYELGTLVIKE